MCKSNIRERIYSSLTVRPDWKIFTMGTNFSFCRILAPESRMTVFTRGDQHRLSMGIAVICLQNLKQKEIDGLVIFVCWCCCCKYQHYLTTCYHPDCPNKDQQPCQMEAATTTTNTYCGCWVWWCLKVLVVLKHRPFWCGISFHLTSLWVKKIPQVFNLPLGINYLFIYFICYLYMIMCD